MSGRDMGGRIITGMNIVSRGGVVTKYKCNRHKFFDGDENNWEESETGVESWSVDDPNMPDWLHEYL